MSLPKPICLAVTHLVPNADGSPQLIGTSGQTVPNQFSPHGQMVHKNLVPNQFGPPGQMVPSPGQMVPRIFWLSRGTGCRDPEIRGTKLVEDHLSKGTKFLETICLWGPNLIGTICPGGSILSGLLSRGTGSSGIKWVWAQMRISLCFTQTIPSMCEPSK